MSHRRFALSIKQPWAALIVSGRKTIEVRRWPTLRRGLVLIHAARAPDSRPEAWVLLPEDLRETAQLAGGIVGTAELIDCKAYRTREAFARDHDRHLNDLSWFQRRLYGFVFVRPRPLAFRPCPGRVRFFSVGGRLPAKQRLPARQSLSRGPRPS